MLITNKALSVLIFALLFDSSRLEGAVNLDCDYFDTVDLSGITPYSNGSYPYENVLIPLELTGVYDYVITGNSDERIPVKKHVRGCACKLRSCVRFCCHHNQLFEDGQCLGETDKVLNYNPILNITLNNGSVVERHVLNEFVVQRHLPMPCENLPVFGIDNRAKGFQWTLFENGTFMRNWDNVSSNKREYCLQPNDFGTEILLIPYNCSENLSKPSFKIFICLSLLCFLITIFVYSFLPKLRNFHGKCFVCYLISLFIGYSMLLLFMWDVHSSKTNICALTGYIGYFGIMAAFFWLTVISLDLWTTFRGTRYNVKNFAPRNHFLVHSLYAWGMALILTLLIFIIDILTKDSKNPLWKPGVSNKRCWIKTEDWSAMIYFYGPMLTLIIFNTILFIMTSKSIMKVKKGLNEITKKQERKQKLNSDTQNYGFFLRLFIIMGISWSLEIISYSVSKWKVGKTVFLFADYFHYCEGIIILILFVLKRSIFRACVDRIENQSQRPQIRTQATTI